MSLEGRVEALAITDGIRDDRTIVDPLEGIETYYCPLEGIGLVQDNDEGEGYLRIIGDDGIINVEIRVPLATLRDNGWFWADPRPMGKG